MKDSRFDLRFLVSLVDAFVVMPRSIAPSVAARGDDAAIPSPRSTIASAASIATPPYSNGQLEFRRHLIKERQHQRDTAISHKNHINALDGLLARSPIAPSQAPAFVEQIDRPKLTENVAREALMQYRDRTIEFIAPVALAAVIDEYTIFGPKLGDRLPSFPGVSLSEHLVEIAFDERLYRIRHSSLAPIFVPVAICRDEPTLVSQRPQLAASPNRRPHQKPVLPQYCGEVANPEMTRTIILSVT